VGDKKALTVAPVLCHGGFAALQVVRGKMKVFPEPATGGKC
jgi:hypothetical protein